ncbi:MAG: hypothetical protein ACYC6W_12555 [Nitrosotalea sp.]
MKKIEKRQGEYRGMPYFDYDMDEVVGTINSLIDELHQLQTSCKPESEDRKEPPMTIPEEKDFSLPCGCEADDRGIKHPRCAHFVKV